MTASDTSRSAVIVGSGAWHVLRRCLNTLSPGGRGQGEGERAADARHSPSPHPSPVESILTRTGGEGESPGRADGFALGAGAPRDTPFGPSRPVFDARLPDGRHVLLLTRHGETRYDLGASSVNYRANLWALKDLGADLVLATSACGGIDSGLAVGQFVLPHDVIDATTRRAKTFFEGTGLGVLRHAEPFCPAVRAALAEAMADMGVPHAAEGVYAVTDGPRLETPAEVRAYAAQGATVVGMTVAPEFALARELEMCYAPLAWVVNPAEGVRDRPYRPDVLFEGMATEEEMAAADAAAERVPAILSAALSRLGPARSCHCRRAMQRYRDEGAIGDDFRTWIEPGE